LRRTAALKEYYRSLVSTLCVLYALLAGIMALGQVLGAGNALRRFNHYLQIPQWANRFAFPLLFAAFMFALAYHLWFKKRTALLVLVAFIVVKACFDLSTRMDPTWSIISLVIAAFFLTSWSAFVVTPDRYYVRRFIEVAVITIPALLLYGSVGLYLGRKEYGVAGGTISYLKNAWLMVVGRSTVTFVGRDLLFKWTLVVVSLLMIAYMLLLLFRPHRRPAPYNWDEDERARKILETWGGDSLSYFNTRKGKSFFFLGEECFLAYAVVGGMALISADPIGQKDLFGRLFTNFRKHCETMGWRVGGVGQSDETVGLFKTLGVHNFVLGEESILDVTSFTLEGRGVRKLRQSVNQMERAGVTVEFMYNASIPSHVRHVLQEISKDWRGDNPETGFAMGLGRLLSASDPDCLLALAYDSDSKPVGFQYYVPMYPHKGYSMDVTRTMIGAPRPLPDYLVAKTALFLKDEGYNWMSLHFLALSQYYRDGKQNLRSRFWAFVARRIDRWFPVVSAYQYDKKFSPEYVKRYLLYPSYLEFLRAGFTVIAAESALKLTRRHERKRREMAADLDED